MNRRRFRALARDWDAFGTSDPLFGILSDPTKADGKWDVAEFFDSGRAHVRQLLDRLAALHVVYGTGACLDFGCGVGRLTVPLSDVFERTVGVDVAPSMIQRACEFHRESTRCEFVVNRSADLRQFTDRTFDLVHSCLVLQHIVPEIALGYVTEFFRVAKAGGLVVFQLPAETWSEAAITAMHALPDAGYAAGIAVRQAPPALEASRPHSLRVQLTNTSPATWKQDIPGGRHISIANHWLRPDGTMAIHDDGRAGLPCTIAPGESVEVALTVTAPAEPGEYVLEIDLVQELVCWFAQKGSPTTRVRVTVEAPMMGRGVSLAAEPLDASRNRLAFASTSGVSRGLGGIVKRLWATRRPTFAMYTVSRAEVEAVVRANGGCVLEAIDDNAAGAAWRSYTYVCRRLSP